MMSEMTPRTCPVCGNSDESRVFAPANFNLDQLDEFAFASRKIPEYMNLRLIVCPQCDLLYANPVLPTEKILSAYEAAAFASQEEAALAAKTYGHLLDGFLDRLPPGLDGALDIGTGDGAFLAELVKRGFTHIHGIEPSKAPIQAAKEDLRPLIRQGIFNPDDFQKESVALVSCFQTFEHAGNPLEIARGAFKILKKGGIFFAISHNRRSLAVKMMGKGSPIFDIEHLQLFSPRSVRFLFEKAGFKKVIVKRFFNTYPLHYWMKLSPLPWKNKIMALMDKSIFRRVPLALYVGNMAVIGVKDAES
jgi:SAM-dependent methyltransferase